MTADFTGVRRRPNGAPVKIQILQRLDLRALALVAVAMYWLGDWAIYSDGSIAHPSPWLMLNTENWGGIALRAMISMCIVLLGFLAQGRRSVVPPAADMSDFLENTTDAFVLVDDEWHILNENSRAKRLFQHDDINESTSRLWDRYPEFCSFFYTPLTQTMSKTQSTPITGYYPPSRSWLEIHPYQKKKGLALFIRDISVERDLRDENNRMQAIIDNLYDGIIAIDRNSIIKVFNQAAEGIFQFQRSEVIGKNIAVLMPQNMHHEHHGYMQRYMRTGNSKIVNTGTREVIAKRKDGTTFPLDLGVSEQQIGDELLFVGIVRDITDRRQKLDALQHASNYDELTGLANRSLLNLRLMEAIDHCKQSANLVAVLFLDLDHFKQINDTLGHAAGDALLQEVAKRLKDSVRNSDTVARWGGDEFVVLLAGLAKAEESGRVAQTIREALSKPVQFEGQNIGTGCSIGISMYPQDGDNIETLQKAADEAMYQAKKQGRGRYQYYSQTNP